MRVLLISGAAPPTPCGVGDYTAKLAEALGREPDFIVGLLTSQTSRPAELANVELLPVMSHWRLSALPHLWRTLRRWKPDVVHFQYPAQCYGVSFLPSLIPAMAWLLGCKVVRTWHEKMSWHKLVSKRGTLQFLLQAIVPGKFITVRPNFGSLLHPVFRYIPWHRQYAYIASTSAIPVSNLTDEERLNLRSALLRGKKRLIVFFGFMQRLKGIDLLFDIANPDTDHLVIMGAQDPESDYSAEVASMAAKPDWAGNVTITGFLPADHTANILAAADAVVLPLREGAGSWNTSLQAAMLQQTFVVTTTAAETHGYDESRNLYLSAIDDTAAMRQALNDYAGWRPAPRTSVDTEWRRIAQHHSAIYHGRDL